MKTILNQTTHKLELSKSQFLAYSFYVENLTQAEQELQALKNIHPKATHICYGVVTTVGEKCSDDGEPSSTAGMPILTAIKKAGYQNVLIAVVRYFGGIKLGAGGLVRAYGNATKEVLQKSGEATLLVCNKAKLCLGYETYNNQFLPQITKQPVWVQKTEFLNMVEVSVLFSTQSQALAWLAGLGELNTYPETYLERKEHGKHYQN